jgi:nucleoside-diphosphate-sugar epimerase
LPKILVTGSSGQIGSELVGILRQRYGRENVVADDMRAAPGGESGPTASVDVTDRDALGGLVSETQADTIYHLAAILSAVGEKNPDLAWRVNMQGLKNVLDAARDGGVSKVFWPSSIAVFGPDAQKVMTPQSAPTNPMTIYGVSKVAGELLCNYYHSKYGLDVRSVRYPGLISGKTKPGGGTTDYAVEMFFAAAETGRYECFLREDTRLPMMYMPDALRATLELMDADLSKVNRYSGYNLAAMSFTPGELAAEIRKAVPGFECEFAPDYRQRVADGWPESIDDSEARREWGWKPVYDLQATAADMLRLVEGVTSGALAKG